MLPPDYLAALGDALLPLYDAYQTSLINDMARRIAKIGMSDASVWQIMAYQEAGGVYNDAIGHLARLTGQTQHELRKQFEAAGATAMAYDDAVYKAAGLTPIPISQSPAMLQALTAGLQKTEGILRNWTMTTAVTSQQAFISAVDTAYMQVMGGGMSVQQAVKEAVKQIAGDGLYVLYPSGHRDKIDVAVRRALVTGVNQTCAQMSLAYAEEMECDKVEVTAHFGARPSHAEWQGGVYRISTGEFERVTGYGEGDGLCGWNCRHSFYPYMDGVSRRTYSDRALREMDNATVLYKGEAIPLYEATQLQRAMEREIRATKREWNALKSAEAADMGTVSYREEYQKTALELKKQREALKALEAETGLRDQASRTQVLGFGRSEASSATWAARKAVPKVANAPDTILQAAVENSALHGIIPSDVSISSVRVIAGAGTSTELRAAAGLAEKYGGKTSQWEKKSGIIESAYHTFEVHWYELGGKQYDVKLKRIKEKP